uniref:Zona pellucida sperm-binding protein 4 n=1 Tax=Esox lucius TaxID=8010 RepID=A0A3P9ANK5_ESOLU
MAMRWSAICLVVVAMLGCLCDTEHLQTPEQPSPQNPEHPYPPRPAQPYPQNPEHPHPPRPAQPYPQNPEHPHPPRPAQPYPQNPEHPYPPRPAQPYPQRPAQPFPQRPAQPFPQRPAQPFPQKPAQPFPQKPAQPYPQRPAQPIQKPAQPYPQKPAQPYPHKPAQPYPQRPAQPYPQKPAQPYPQKPAQPYPQKPAQPYPQRPAQPHLQKPAPPKKHHVSSPTETHEHTCEVDDNRKVTCGLPDITAEHCQAISCCYDGHKCYYGKAVTVQCTKDGQFVVVVARDATVPSLDLESIHLLEGGNAHCSPIGTTSAFAIYQFKVTECGTVVTEEHDTIMYENRMSSSYEVGIGPYGAITRDSHYDLLFQCRYTGTSVETLAIQVSPPLNPLIVAVEAPLNVELRLANGHCLMKGCNEEEEAYTSYYTTSDYPVTKVLKDPVYAEVRILGMTDPNIVLMLEQCWATTTQNSNSLPRWDLLVNGCAYHDDRYLTIPIHLDGSSTFPPGAISFHYKRFVFKMFTFVDPTSMVPMKENVFIHCSTTICHRNAGNCEQTCNRQKREVSTEGQKETKGEVVSSQQVIMIDQPVSA